MTARSMTGFGKAHGLVSGWNAEVTVRSVNHRFLDLSVRLREEYIEAESILRKIASDRLSRGKIEMSVRLKRHVEPARDVHVHEDLLRKLMDTLGELSTRFPLTGRLEVRDVLLLPNVLNVETSADTLSPEEIEGLGGLAARAVDELVQMRETEGKLIASDLAERIEFLKRMLDRVAASREKIVERLHRQVHERVAVLFSDVPVDPARIAQEAVLLADRSDVTEEITRLAAHLGQFLELLERSKEPAGKKLDFLTQEIQREINTLGAKSRDLATAHDVIEMKTEAEKIREQVQNLE